MIFCAVAIVQALLLLSDCFYLLRAFFCAEDEADAPARREPGPLPVLQGLLASAVALALAAALARGALPRLEILTLGRNAIGDAGLVALAPPLRRLPALREVYLYGNQIGDAGVTALGEGLKHNTSLTELS